MSNSINNIGISIGNSIGITGMSTTMNGISIGKSGLSITMSNGISKTIGIVI